MLLLLLPRQHHSLPTPGNPDVTPVLVSKNPYDLAPGPWGWEGSEILVEPLRETEAQRGETVPASQCSGWPSGWHRCNTAASPL